jgi:NADH-quinone oxidoreductase subunit F
MKVLRKYQLLVAESWEEYVGKGRLAVAVQLISQRTPASLLAQIRNSRIWLTEGIGFGSSNLEPGNAKYIVCDLRQRFPEEMKSAFIVSELRYALIEGLILLSHALNIRQCFILTDYASLLSAAVLQMYDPIRPEFETLGIGRTCDIAVFDGKHISLANDHAVRMMSDLRISHLWQVRFKPPFHMANRSDTYPLFAVAAESVVALAAAYEWAYLALDENGPKKPFTYPPKLYSVKYTHSKTGALVEANEETLLSDILKQTLTAEQLTELKAVAVGGVGGIVLSYSQCEKVKLTYCAEECGLPIAMNGNILLLDKNDCAVEFLQTVYETYRQGNCGVCMPCREGTQWLSEIAASVFRGKSSLRDFDVLSPLSHHLKNLCLCTFPDTLCEMTDSVLKLFSEEFIYHINYGICDVKNPAI